MKTDPTIAPETATDSPEVAGYAAMACSQRLLVVRDDDMIGEPILFLKRDLPAAQRHRKKLLDRGSAEIGISIEIYRLVPENNKDM